MPLVAPHILLTVGADVAQVVVVNLVHDVEDSGYSDVNYDGYEALERYM